MKIASLILCLAYTLSSHAQLIGSTVIEDPKAITHTSNWALREKTNYRDGEQTLQIQNTGNNLVQLGYTARLSTEKHGLILHKFDASGNELMTNKLENGERAFGPITTTSLEFGSQIFLIYFKYEDKDSMRLFLSEIDKKTLALTHTQPLFAYQQDNVGIFKMAKALAHPIITRVSTDSNKMLIAYQTPKKQLFTCVISTPFNMLRKTTSKTQLPEDADLTDALVENSGNMELIFSQSNSSFSTNPLKGVLTVRIDNKEKFYDFTSSGTEAHLLNCHLKSAKDNNNVYIYGDYAGETGSAGVWLTDMESDKFKVSKPSLLPYPEDYKEKIYKIGFGLKRKGNYGVMDVDYQLVEFENGSMALCGNPVSRHDNTYIENGKTQGYVMYFAGPIMVSFFEKNKKGQTTMMIPRNQNMSLGSDGIYYPYHNKLIVFYNDYKKNINEEQPEDELHAKGGAIVHEMSLAYVVINQNGAVQEKKLIIEGVSRMNCYNTSQFKAVGDNKIYIPSVGTDKKSDVFKVVMITIE